eukprot:Opistho-2@85282
MSQKEEMRELIERTLNVAEKAARIARACRSDPCLFSLLVQEKKGSDANKRFVQDFKTLADVLIQETVRFDLSQRYPALNDHIYGEEDNKFTNAKGESVVLAVQPSEAETRDLLSTVLDGNEGAAASLASIVHDSVHSIAADDLPFLQLLDGAEFDVNNIGVWIDPIDGTNEYITAATPKSTDGIYSTGLATATVLIGAFDRSTGSPIAGVVNQPFYSRVGGCDDGAYVGRHLWGVCQDDVRVNNLPAKESRARQSFANGQTVVVVSASESAAALQALASIGATAVPAAACGYKQLCVIDGHADAYFLSKGSTYRWDTCGPDAILRSNGGGVFMQSGEGLTYHVPNPGSEGSEDKAAKWNNAGGIIAARNTPVARKLSAVVWDAIRKQ